MSQKALREERRKQFESEIGELETTRMERTNKY